MINVDLMTVLSTLTAVVLAAAILQHPSRAISEEELDNLLVKFARADGEETAEERDAQQVSLAQILTEQPDNTTTPNTSSDRRPQPNRGRPRQAQARPLLILAHIAGVHGFLLLWIL